MDRAGPRWYISILHDATQPSRDDKDFYYAECYDNDNYGDTEFFPPSTGWCSCDAAYDPVPVMTVTVDAVDDDYWLRTQELDSSAAFDDYESPRLSVEDIDHVDTLSEDEDDGRSEEHTSELQSLM